MQTNRDSRLLNPDVQPTLDNKSQKKDHLYPPLHEHTHELVIGQLSTPEEPKVQLMQPLQEYQYRSTPVSSGITSSSRDYDYYGGSTGRVLRGQPNQHHPYNCNPRPKYEARRQPPPPPPLPSHYPRLTPAVRNVSVEVPEDRWVEWEYIVHSLSLEVPRKLFIDETTLGYMQMVGKVMKPHVDSKVYEEIMKKEIILQRIMRTTGGGASQ